MTKKEFIKELNKLEEMLNQRKESMEKIYQDYLRAKKSTEDMEDQFNELKQLAETL